jgi:hypothetical protein
VVFDAIRELMAPPEKKRRRIGFKAGEGKCALEKWRPGMASEWQELIGKEKKGNSVGLVFSNGEKMAKNLTRREITSILFALICSPSDQPSGLRRGYPYQELPGAS